MVRLPNSNLNDGAVAKLRARWDAGQRDLRVAVRLAIAYLHRLDESGFAEIARAAIEALHETPPQQRDVTAVAFLLMGVANRRLTVTWQGGKVREQVIVNMSAIEMSWLDADAEYERLAALLCSDDLVIATFGDVADPDPRGRLAAVIWGGEPTREPGLNRAQRRARRKRARGRR